MANMNKKVRMKYGADFGAQLQQQQDNQSDQQHNTVEHRNSNGS